MASRPLASSARWVTPRKTGPLPAATPPLFCCAATAPSSRGVSAYSRVADRPVVTHFYPLFTSSADYRGNRSCRSTDFLLANNDLRAMLQIRGTYGESIGYSHVLALRMSKAQAFLVFARSFDATPGSGVIWGG